MAWAKSTYHSYIIFVTNNQTPLISLQCQTKKIVSVILRRWANKAIWINNITEIRGFSWTYLWDNTKLAIKYSWLKKGRKLLSTTNLCIIVKPGNTIMLSNSRTIFFNIQKFSISLFIAHIKRMRVKKTSIPATSVPLPCPLQVAFAILVFLWSSQFFPPKIITSELLYHKESYLRTQLCWAIVSNYLCWTF